MNYQYLLFDLDGTLFDPKIGMFKSFRFAFNKAGIQEPNEENFNKLVGPPLELSMQKFYGVSEEKAWEVVGLYREHLLEYGMYEYKVYEGMKELLSKLQDQGKILYVVTMKPAKLSKPILQHFHMDQLFTDIYTPDLQGKINKKVELIKQVLYLYPDEPRNAFVMIGDRADDIVAALGAEIDSIAVGFGYGSKEELEQAKPTQYAETVKNLEKLLL